MCKECENNEKREHVVEEEQLGRVSGGGVFTENRYDSHWCRNLTQIRQACPDSATFPFRHCDHYTRTQAGNTADHRPGYRYKCAMNAFPEYFGEANGKPAMTAI